MLSCPSTLKSPCYCGQRTGCRVYCLQCDYLQLWWRRESTVRMCSWWHRTQTGSRKGSQGMRSNPHMPYSHCQASPQNSVGTCHICWGRFRIPPEAATRSWAQNCSRRYKNRWHDQWYLEIHFCMGLGAANCEIISLHIRVVFRGARTAYHSDHVVMGTADLQCPQPIHVQCTCIG